MKVNVAKELKTFDGVAMRNEANETITLKSLLVNALLTPEQKDDGITKVMKYELAKIIHGSAEVDFDEKQIVMLKEVCGKMYGPLAVGQIYEALKV